MASYHFHWAGYCRNPGEIFNHGYTSKPRAAAIPYLRVRRGLLINFPGRSSASLFYISGNQNLAFGCTFAKTVKSFMSNSYKAIYYNELNHFYCAEIFLSSVTLTMRYKNESGEMLDRHWLGEDIVSLEEGDLQSTLIYKNESGKPERLVIKDRELLAEIKYQFRHRKFTGQRFRYHAGRTRYRILMILFVIVLFLGFIYLFFVPWLGERVANNFSKEREIALGNQMYRSIITSSRIDARKTIIVNNFYKALQFDAGYPVEITVVESGEVNAFAVPGGHIVIYEGILENMKTPGELAALLGHEASHVKLRHSLRNIFRSLARKMFLLLILGGDAGIAGYLADRADDLKGLQYSRELETEADDNGMELMSRAKVNPEGMLQLMQLLSKEGEGRETSALLSTHPVFESRIKNIRQQLKRIDYTPENTDERKTETALAALFHEIYESGNSY
jgi:Zn-dependent protease with chaperone function